MRNLLGVAKLVVVAHWWKSVSPPIAFWYLRLWHLLAMEKLADKIYAKRVGFSDIWTLLVSYLSEGPPTLAYPPQLKSLDLF